MNYLWHILILVALYSLLAMSLNLVVGYAGLMSLGHAAFYGLGAYSTALLMTRAHWNFFPALLVSGLLTAFLSLIIGGPSLRLRGDFFVLATLGFQVIVFSLLYNWTGLTQGPYGIAGIPVPMLLTIRFDDPFRYFVLSGASVGLCAMVLHAVTEAPFGRVLRALRDDPTAASALGKNVSALKIQAFALAASIAAIAGGLFAGYMRYIDPSSFTTMESIFILSIVVIGGAGNFIGPFLGAILMVVLPEVLRFVHIPDSAAANVRQILYGVVLILLMRYRPQGIQGEYQFD